MQANRNAWTPPENGAPVSELEVTRWRQAQEIQSLNDTIDVYRKGASALAVENAVLRMQLADPQAGRSSRAGELTEIQLPLDTDAPAAARAAVTAALSDRVPPTILHEVQVVTSELVANGVRHSNASQDAELVFRIEHSPTMVRLEVEDPGHDGVIALKLPDHTAGSGFGLHLVQFLSERWGAERVETGATRVWAQLTLATPVVLPPDS